MLNPAETVKIFQRNGNSRTYSAGEAIFAQGEPGNFMYGILEGEVQMLVHGEVVETLEQGDIFGQGALVRLDHLRVATAVAKTDCQLAFLDKERFLFAVQETPMFALQVMRSYADRLRHIKESI